MNTPSVVIVNYGLGNLFSVQRALQYIGAQGVISDDRSVIEAADRLVVPGVGAFGEGMRNLKRLGLDVTIKAYAGSGRPILGICLGMQLLMTESEEFGRHEGLNCVPGHVVRLQNPRTHDRFKIPHIGWNSLHPSPWAVSGKSGWAGTLLEDVPEGAFVYFLHSYRVVLDDPSCALAITRYGHDTYCSVITQRNLMGAQFHPERSGEVGLNIYRWFVFKTSHQVV